MGVYSDIIDSSVINHLKFGKVDTSNNVFKLFCNISPAIFWISSALVIASSYIGDPIKCMSKHDIAETVCWLHGTYHIPDSISSDIYGETCKRTYDKYGSHLTMDQRDADTPYYQWVPFMLIIHGLIFLIAGKVWKALENGLLEQFGDKNEISRLIEEEELNKHANEKARRFRALSRNANNRRFYYFLFCEMINIVALIFNFCLIDVFLGGRFSSYGSDVVNYLIQKDPNAQEQEGNPMCSAFPTLTACKFKFGGVVKNSVDEEVSLCVLSQNIINQKIYLFLWFWMILLMVAAAINTIFRLCLIFVPNMRKMTIIAWMNTKRKRGAFLDQDNVVSRNCLEMNRIGNWFLMDQIGKNSNPYYFRKFLYSVYENDMRENGRKQSTTDNEEGTVKVPLF